MRSSVVFWRRKFLAVGAVILMISPLAVRADGWAWLPGSNQNQSSSASASEAVRKDDSQMMVVQADYGTDEPIVETANKPKVKKSSSLFSSKIWHPTKWFSSPKPKK